MRLNEAYDKYKDGMQFYCVYIHEAHPSDGWQVKVNLTDDVIYDQPSTMEERADVAEACQLDLRLKMPILLGDMKNEAALAYAAHPVRLFVIDENGILAHRSGMGPRDLDVEGALAAIGKLAGP